VGLPMGPKRSSKWGDMHLPTKKEWVYLAEEETKNHATKEKRSQGKRNYRTGPLVGYSTAAMTDSKE